MGVLGRFVEILIKQRSQLVPKLITDKRGFKRKVWVKPEEAAAAPKPSKQVEVPQQQTKAALEDDVSSRVKKVLGSIVEDVASGKGSHQYAKFRDLRNKLQKISEAAKAAGNDKLSNHASEMLDKVKQIHETKGWNEKHALIQGMLQEKPTVPTKTPPKPKEKPTEKPKEEKKPVEKPQPKETKPVEKPVEKPPAKEKKPTRTKFEESNIWDAHKDFDVEEYDDYIESFEKSSTYIDYKKRLQSYVKVPMGNLHVPNNIDHYKELSKTLKSKIKGGLTDYKKDPTYSAMQAIALSTRNILPITKIEVGDKTYTLITTDSYVKPHVSEKTGAYIGNTTIRCYDDNMKEVGTWMIEHSKNKAPATNGVAITSETSRGIGLGRQSYINLINHFGGLSSDSRGMSSIDAQKAWACMGATRLNVGYAPVIVSNDKNKSHKYHEIVSGSAQFVILKQDVISQENVSARYEALISDYAVRAKYTKTLSDLDYENAFWEGGIKEEMQNFSNKLNDKPDVPQKLKNIVVDMAKNVDTAPPSYFDRIIDSF